MVRTRTGDKLPDIVSRWAGAGEDKLPYKITIIGDRLPYERILMRITTYVKSASDSSKLIRRA